MASTRIEWTDETWNPLTGCSKVSEGCRNCYAIRQARRMDGQGVGYDETTQEGPNWTGRINLLHDRLIQPLRWTRPRRVFVNSMSDLFHPKVPDQFIHRVFAVMAQATDHIFQVLTKRPARMGEVLSKIAHDASDGQVEWVTQPPHEHGGMDTFWTPWPLPNVWLGTSAENQETTDTRLPALVETPAYIRFVSCEPLLGGINLTSWIHDLDWIIVGGESGPGSRPMHPDWPRWLRDQCQDHETPFFFKQWGSWTPATGPDEHGKDAYTFPDGVRMLRRGWKSHNHTLDGEQHQAFPDAPQLVVP